MFKDYHGIFGNGMRQSQTTPKLIGRPKRDEVISEDDILNLKIDLELKDVNQLLERM